MDDLRSSTTRPTRCRDPAKAGSRSRMYRSRAHRERRHSAVNIALADASQPLVGAHNRAAVSITVSSTGCKSKVERLMTLQHSLVAVWYSSDSSGRASIAQLAEQPRVLHRDHRLSREVLQQRDLLVGERPHLLPVERRSCRATAILAQRDDRLMRAARAQGMRGDREPSSTFVRPEHLGHAERCRDQGRAAGLSEKADPWRNIVHIRG